MGAFAGLLVLPGRAYQTTSSYDSARELASTTAPATAAAPSGATTTFSYDPAGNKLSRTDPNGVTTTWTESPLGKQTSATYSGSAAPSVTDTYDANGDMTGMTDGSGTSSYALDPFGEFTSTTNGAGQITGYGYDADGHITSITYPLPAAVTWASTSTVGYGYDHADRLTTVTDFNGNTITIGNTADGKPNSVSLGATGDTIATTYDSTDAPSAIALNNSTSTLQSFTYANAPAGDILSETDTPASSQSPAVYTYDAKDRVTSMTPGTGPALNYGNGLRASTTITPSGQSATTQQYAWNTQAAIPEMIMDSGNAYIYGTGVAPIEQVSLSTGAITYLVTDSLGSVRGTVNPSGALTGTTSYDAWGNAQTAGGLTSATPFGFAGGYTDPTGLIYLINRYYDPSTGQFLSVDPDISSTLQLYAYAGGNPVSQTDPTGKEWVDATGWILWEYWFGDGTGW